MKPTKAFTLIELLVVMVIIAITFAITTVSFTNVVKNSRDARRKSDLSSIQQALELCRSYAGTYPTSVTGGGTIACGSPSQTYMTSVPVDPKTGSSYTYSSPAPYTTYSLSATLENSSPSTYTVTNP